MIKNGDLKGLIIPYIGIDEYKPKTGTEKEVIVLSFFAKDDIPAQDLAKFLEMSVADTLDIEAKDIPDSNNNYPIYVELERNKYFWKGFDTLISDIERTVGKLDWRVSVFKHDDLISIDDPRLKTRVISSQQEYEQKFLKTDEYDADLAPLKNEGIIYEAYKGPSETIIKLFELDQFPVQFEKSYSQRRLQQATTLDILQIGKYMVAEQQDTIVLFKSVG